VTREEFIKRWTEGRGQAAKATPDGYRDGDDERIAIPCAGDCEWGNCHGWRMVSAKPEHLADELADNPEIEPFIPERIRRTYAFVVYLEEARELTA
jgi:hypothetical protein